MDPVTRLHTIRVLLAGRDRRFLRAAGALLGQSGFVTKSLEKTSEIHSVVVRWRPNVVVIDASGAVARSLRAAAAVEAADPPTPVLVVADEPDVDRCRGLAKWEAFDDLPLTVERTYLAGAGQGVSVANG
jgi:DNA-binding NtrC family response regulator